MYSIYTRIKELESSGKSHRAIANILKLNRRTVAKYSKMSESQALSYFRCKSQNSSGFDIAKEYVEETLHQTPSVSKRALYRLVLKQYPNIELSERSFRNYVSKIKSRFLSSNTAEVQTIGSEHPQHATESKVISSALPESKVKKRGVENIFLSQDSASYGNEYKGYSADRLSKKRIKQEILKIDANLEQAFKIRHTNPEKCKQISRSTLKDSQEIVYALGIGKSYYLIGISSYHLSTNSEALQNYLLAEPYYLEKKYYHGLRMLYHNIGHLYEQWEDLEKALDYYHKNLDLEVHFSDPTLTASILYNIGIVYLKLSQREKALHFFTETLKMAKKHNLSNLYISSLSGLGLAHYRLNNIPKADEYLLKAVSACEKKGDITNLSHVHANLVGMKIDLGLLDEALKILDKGLKFAIESKDRYAEARIYLLYSRAYMELDNEAEYKKYSHKCRTIAEAEDYRAIEMLIYNLDTEYYKKKSDYQSAFACYTKLQEIKEFLSNEKRTKAIEEIRSRMEVERIEKEKTILNRKNLELQQLNLQIIQQKEELEKVKQDLIALNHNLEFKVEQEVAKRRQQEQIIIQKSKLESLGQMAAGIAHEINQPLGLIHMATQNLFNKQQQLNVSEDYLNEKAAFVFENITRIKKIIEHIRIFSREQKSGYEKFNVLQTLEEALSMIYTQCKHNNIIIEKKIDTVNPYTIGNKYRLEQVLLNLLSNSKDALDSKYDEYDDRKRIIIRVTSEKKRIFIDVEDNGCGIDKNSVQKVFEPFYTTKEESKGTGLGLSICYGIIKDMNGKISIHSKKNKQTIVTVELPEYIEKRNKGTQ